MARTNPLPQAINLDNFATLDLELSGTESKGKQNGIRYYKLTRQYDLVLPIAKLIATYSALKSVGTDDEKRFDPVPWTPKDPTARLKLILSYAAVPNAVDLITALNGKVKDAYVKFKGESKLKNLNFDNVLIANSKDNLVGYMSPFAPTGRQSYGTNETYLKTDFLKFCIKDEGGVPRRTPIEVQTALTLLTGASYNSPLVGTGVVSFDTVMIANNKVSIMAKCVDFTMVMFPPDKIEELFPTKGIIMPKLDRPEFALPLLDGMETGSIADAVKAMTENGKDGKKANRKRALPALLEGEESATPKRAMKSFQERTLERERTLRAQLSKITQERDARAKLDEAKRLLAQAKHVKENGGSSAMGGSEAWQDADEVGPDEATDVENSNIMSDVESE